MLRTILTVANIWSEPCHSSNTYAHGSHNSSPDFIPGHVTFMRDEVATGQIFYKYFGFPCQFSFHQLLHIHCSTYHMKLHCLNTDSTIKEHINNASKTSLIWAKEWTLSKSVKVWIMGLLLKICSRVIKWTSYGFRQNNFILNKFTFIKM
jgi:hypothetical protein